MLQADIPYSCRLFHASIITMINFFLLDEEMIVKSLKIPQIIENLKNYELHFTSE